MAAFPPPHNTAAKTTAAIALGIVGVIISPTFICAILAIILGYQARAEIALDPRGRSAAAATIGFVLGIVGLSLGVLIVVISIGTG